MRSIGAFALAAAPLFLAVHADVDLDGDDVPRECRAICRPIVELSRRCDASDLFDDDDEREDEYERHEDHLRAQCFCTNDSFDVGRITVLCGDCIRQNQRRDDDDDDDDDDNISDELEDIGRIMATCGFTAGNASYASAQSTVADSISVVASAPTAASQLTTTFTGTWTTGGFPIETGAGAGGNGGNNNGNDGNNNGNGGNNNNGNDGNNNNNNNNNGNGGDDGDDDNGAAGGLSRMAVLYSFGAFAAGVAFLAL